MVASTINSSYIIVIKKRVYHKNLPAKFFASIYRTVKKLESKTKTMFATIEEGLTEAQKIGKREQVLKRAKEIQQYNQKRDHLISLLESIELAYIEVSNE